MMCCWLRRGGLSAGRSELGRQRRELGLEAAAGIGAGQAADLHRSALYVLAGGAGAGPDEDPPTADHEGEQQAAESGDAADQGGQLARVVRDGQAYPGNVAGKRDRALAARQLQ